MELHTRTPAALHRPYFRAAAIVAKRRGLVRIAVITWDASLHGCGMMLRWWTNFSGLVIIGTLLTRPGGPD